MGRDNEETWRKFCEGNTGMTDDQRLHWQIAATIYAAYAPADLSVNSKEEAAIESIKAAERLRLMIVGDYHGGDPKPKPPIDLKT